MYIYTNLYIYVFIGPSEVLVIADDSADIDIYTCYKYIYVHIYIYIYVYILIYIFMYI